MCKVASGTLMSSELFQVMELNSLRSQVQTDMEVLHLHGGVHFSVILGKVWL